MKEDNIDENKTFMFAVRIVKCCGMLYNSHPFIRPLSTQLMRSGTSISANVAEGLQAQSKSDFIHKFSISLKEANETAQWLKLLHATDYLDDRAYLSMKSDCVEILKLLTSILKTARANTPNNKV